MDRTTEMLSAYTCGLTYEELGPTVVEQVKRTLLDTMGCAIGGYDSEPAEIARSLAEESSGRLASRIIGTRFALRRTWQPLPMAWRCAISIATILISPPAAATPAT